MIERITSTILNIVGAIVTTMAVYYLCDATSADRVTISFGGLILFAIAELSDKIEGE